MSEPGAAAPACRAAERRSRRSKAGCGKVLTPSMPSIFSNCASSTPSTCHRALPTAASVHGALAFTETSAAQRAHPRSAPGVSLPNNYPRGAGLLVASFPAHRRLGSQAGRRGGAPWSRRSRLKTSGQVKMPLGERVFQASAGAPSRRRACEQRHAVSTTRRCRPKSK